jgi:hypothetical protein
MSAYTGDRVHVCLYDARVIVATVNDVWLSTSGWKARVTSGPCVHTINLDQIIAMVHETTQRERAERHGHDCKTERR